MMTIILESWWTEMQLIITDILASFVHLCSVQFWSRLFQKFFEGKEKGYERIFTAPLTLLTPILPPSMWERSCDSHSALLSFPLF